MGSFCRVVTVQALQFGRYPGGTGPKSTKHRVTSAPVSSVAEESSSEEEYEPRPVVILPGLGNSTGDYAQLSSALNARGIPTVVTEVSRIDWLRNAAGLLDGNYWKGTLRPRPVLDWYLERMQKAIESAKRHGDQVSLIGHSAGGWLARLYMSEFDKPDDIALLLTLGTPHLPPAKEEPGVFDQTRGLLTYINEAAPGAFYAPEVAYVCVAGRYIRGAARPQKAAKLVTPSGAGLLVESENQEEEEETLPAPSFQEKLIGQGYKQVCGRADVWGDGVVPEISAHLDGAENLTLSGVYHSPVGSSSERPWYGSPGVLERWINYLEEDLN